MGKQLITKLDELEYLLEYLIKYTKKSDEDVNCLVIDVVNKFNEIYTLAENQYYDQEEKYITDLPEWLLHGLVDFSELKTINILQQSAIQEFINSIK